MQYNIFKVLPLIVLSISVTGCFAPANTAEEVVTSYLESVKKADYKSVSLLLTKKYQAELETKKIACLNSTDEVEKKFKLLLEKYSTEEKACLANRTKDEKKIDRKNKKKYLENNDIEGLSKLASKCVKNKTFANKMSELTLAGYKKDWKKAEKLGIELRYLLIKMDISSNLKEETVKECNAKALSQKGTDNLLDNGKILSTSTQNDAQKTITVEFTFQRYKQKANFLMYLQDNTWRIENINFLEVENNLLGKFRCQEFTEDFSIRVKKENKLDFYFDGNRFEYKTKLISPNEILIEFKKDKIETFKKTAEGIFIYNNTPCKRAR